MISAIRNSADDLFECTMCGQCCQGYGGTYISHQDSKKIATFLNVTHDKLISQYTKTSGARILLTQQENGYCIFWDQYKACLIHPVKPNMCVNWPFIQPVLNDISNWEIMAALCPGIKTDVEDTQIIIYIRSYINQKPSSR